MYNLWSKIPESPQAKYTGALYSWVPPLKITITVPTSRGSQLKHYKVYPLVHDRTQVLKCLALLFILGK